MAFEQNPQLAQLLNRNYNYGQNNQQYQNPLQRQQGPMMYVQDQPTNKGWWDIIKESLFGSNPQYGYSTDYTPEQQQAFQALLSGGLQNLQNPYEGFEPIQQGIMDYFKQQIVPNVAHQFTTMGGGALSSPDFARQLGGASAGLAAQLAQHKIDYGQRQKQLGLQQAQLGLTPQYQSFQTPATGGLFGGLLNAAPQIANTGIKYGLMMGL